MNKGFTLVEVAIVMVIIGLLIAGTMKSMEIVNIARAKKNISEITVLVNAQHSFYERTARYAGDSDNDGAINHTNLASSAYPNDADTTTVTDIDFPFQELKNMGVLPNQSNAVLARLTSGGPAYFAGSVVTVSGNTTVYNVVVARSVPCETAFQMEINLDKNQPDDLGSAGTGRVRFINSSNAIVSSSTSAWTDSSICASDTKRTTHIAYIFEQL
jgi:prepilin-type N-terminal cleavage/methylation domain-containing protein